MTKKIEETVTQFVTEMLLERGIKAKPSPDTSLIDSGMIDSLSVVTFVGQLENAFGITISMADMTLDNFDTIQFICDFIKSKLSQER
ncbi:MAG: acyl carrier protein [Smithellaceae bacterium]|jgi:acyl carrier protein|nr:acyl carrier protein [Syntrophaceae bacterium]